MPGKETYSCEWCDEVEHAEVYRVWDKDALNGDFCHKHFIEYLNEGNKPWLVKMIKDQDGFRGN